MYSWEEAKNPRWNFAAIDTSIELLTETVAAELVETSPKR